MPKLHNPHRGTGLPHLFDGTPIWPSVDAERVGKMLARCPDYAETDLVETTGIAADLGIQAVHLKYEGTRMGLGSFKALGAAYVIACDAADGNAKGRTYIAASAGNHGLSIAAGARVFGANAVILLAETVPEGFADRLRNEGAQVVRAGSVYEESMAAAMEMAEKNGWTLLSDSSWPGYTEIPHRLMEGYLQMAAEMAQQIPQPPTHIYLQAGVGGLATAVAAYARRIWGDGPEITVVEPDRAPALLESARAGKVVFADGPVSNMGRLDCKEPSLIALNGLARDADWFVTVSDEEANKAVETLADLNMSSTPSGAAGVAAMLAADLPADARVLCIVSETGEGV